MQPVEPTSTPLHGSDRWLKMEADPWLLDCPRLTGRKAICLLLLQVVRDIKEAFQAFPLLKKETIVV